MITKIGLAAGDVWEYLENHNKESRLEDVISFLDGNKNLALMSIGWLAREGHVVLDCKADICVVRLVK